jgi:hypothetical protein
MLIGVTCLSTLAKIRKYFPENEFFSLRLIIRRPLGRLLQEYRTTNKYEENMEEIRKFL